MDVFTNLLEWAHKSIPIKKDQLIILLIALIIAETVGGALYINSLQMRIQTLEHEIENWKNSNLELQKIATEKINYYQQQLKDREKNYQNQLRYMEERMERIEKANRTKIEAEFYKNQSEIFMRIIVSFLVSS